jgi:DNA replication ATP-dependent helicase Dna2
MIEGKESIAALIFKELEDIQSTETLGSHFAVTRLYQAVNYFFNRITVGERIYFTTLFARMVFAGLQFKIPRRDLSLLHHFRKMAYQSMYQDSVSPKLFTDTDLIQLGMYSLNQIVIYICQVPSPLVIMEWESEKWDILFKEPQFEKMIPDCRVLITYQDAAEPSLVGVSEEYPHHAVKIRYQVAGINDSQTEVIQSYLALQALPVSLQLIDIEVEHNGAWVPNQLVIEPDYLVDVTSIAECFKEFGVLTWSYLLNKFKSKPSNPSILLGNASNFFLDEVLVDPAVSFQSLMKQFFKLYPLECTLLKDSEVLDLNVKAKFHFQNLKRVVLEEFQHIGIEPDGISLEPTFISAMYGIQGRLDLFHQKPNSNTAHIIELKSSKPYKTNAYGINPNNYIQTLLYDLLIRSVFQNQKILASYILYSQLDHKALRYAPPIKTQQAEAIQVRNELVLLELRLRKTELLESMLVQLHPAILPVQQGFIANDLQDFNRFYSQLSILEKSYLLEFTGFIAREHHLAKVGEHSDEFNNGMASLWLNNKLEKEENFNILSHLQFQSERQVNGDTHLQFVRRPGASNLANFRAGDIGVLYPHSSSGQSALQHQVFKCTLLEINQEFITLRLRNKQRKNSVFVQWPEWNLEHDLLDSSFQVLYRAVFDFLSAPTTAKELILTTKPPRMPGTGDIQYLLPADLNLEQKQILNKIVQIEDYFLLWGPPGTGKTSIMLRSLAHYLMHQTQDSMLILAYTNRAVDEICEALHSIDLPFLRVGSRFTTPAKFWPFFLDEQASLIEKRSDFRNLILQHRIVVGTLSSLHGRSELFALKDFTWAIVDEASQILEPMLAGLLTKSKKWVLIGDHKQMPAVVVQRKEDSASQKDALQEIGLRNLRNSLFERLMNQCKKHDWHWAYDILRCQGRMHRDIMSFPSKAFYGGELKLLDHSGIRAEQEAPLAYQLDELSTPLEQKIASNRMLYLPSATDAQGKSKINIHEARLVIESIHAIEHLYQVNDMVLHSQSIGVITPYRAQIAQIRKSMEEQGMSPDRYTIDTVERYQGGARDIIILSLCTNRFSQVQNMVSLSEDGVDRKLNVALTRARKQLILIGNEEILNQYPVYSELLTFCRR